VLGQRAVTGLAGDMGVDALALHIVDLGVATFAGPMTGEHDRFRCNFGQGGAPVVTVLAKATRDEDAARHQEQDDTSSKNCCHPPEMPCVLQIRHRVNASPCSGDEPAAGSCPSLGRVGHVLLVDNGEAH